MGIIDRIRGVFSRKPQPQSVQLPSQSSVAAFNDKMRAAYGYGTYSGYGSLGRFAGGNSGGAGWNYGLSNDGGGRIIDHYRTRQNARDAYHDSLDARSIVDSFADDVVGTGLTLEPTPDYRLLGITPEQAEEWAEDVETRFHAWAADKKQHRSQTLDFYQAQRLYQIGQKRDNDLFVRFFYSPRRDLQSPLQYEFVDANQIRGDAYTTTWGPNTGDDGIERNADGSEKSYKIWVSDPAKRGAYKYVTVPRVGPKSGRIFMIHGFRPEYAGQGRGYSPLYTALQSLENITDFSYAVLKKAINASNNLMTVENEHQDPSNPLQDEALDLNYTAVGRAVVPEQLSATNEELTNALVNVCPVPEVANATPGSTNILNLTQGDKLRMLDNKIPGDSYKEFVGGFLERLAAAIGTSVEVVQRKFSSNYSASRATLILVWAHYQIERKEMDSDLVAPAFEAWLSEEIAAGRVSAPGWQDPRMKAAWLSHRLVGTPLPSIDPTKEANARKTNLEMNLTTVEREARNLNGSSAKSNIAKNRKTFPELAVPYWSVTAGGGVSVDAVTDDDDDEEEDDDA